ALVRARDQAIADVAETRAAVLRRNRGPEQAERAHVGDDAAIEALLAVVAEHAREKLVLRIAAGGIAHHALFLAELAVEIERIFPVERDVLELRGGQRLALLGGLRDRLLPDSMAQAFSCPRSSARFKRGRRASSSYAPCRVASVLPSAREFRPLPSRE